jgi:hypothetical protein
VTDIANLRTLPSECQVHFVKNFQIHAEDDGRKKQQVKEKKQDSSMKHNEESVSGGMAFTYASLAELAAANGEDRRSTAARSCGWAAKKANRCLLSLKRAVDHISVVVAHIDLEFDRRRLADCRIRSTTFQDIELADKTT